MLTTAELMRAGRTTCKRCNSGMRVADGLVGCDVCGAVDEEHPLTVATRAGRGERYNADKNLMEAVPRTKAAPTPAPEVRLESNEGGHAERILALEKRMAAQDARLRSLEERLSMAEQQGQRKHTQRAG